ncbi:hypothetical protein AB0K15_24170 [Amycolatopsis sp. NPDC049253]|uniref:hypothetical protein n=1 Tax=Amycolatopsis sp. NPDC049253 TaxID=3155274 RepID=UPI003427EF2B
MPIGSGSGTARLAVVLLPATDPAHRIGSLLINPGGPADRRRWWGTRRRSRSGHGRGAGTASLQHERLARLGDGDCSRHEVVVEHHQPAELRVRE